MDTPPPPIIYLNDLIDGSVKPLEEWVTNEIYRLKYNIKPRHFDSHCQLVEMVQEDIRRFQAQPQFIIYNENKDTKNEEGDDVEDEEDAEDEEDIEDEENKEQEDSDDQRNETNDKTHINNQQEQNLNSRFTPNQISRHPQTLNRLHALLRYAFIEIMRYCNRHRDSGTPKLLLIEFDKLRRDKRMNVPEFKQNLLKIMFGKVQLTANLVKVWRLMCDWVTRLHLNSDKHATRWVYVSLHAYTAAQRIFITEALRNKQK
jgi:hypothetical protein